MTIKELLIFIKLELARHTHERHRVIIELDKVMFFKLIRFIQFCIKDKQNEPFRNIDPDPNCKMFQVRINGRLTKIIRK